MKVIETLFRYVSIGLSILLPVLLIFYYGKLFFSKTKEGEAVVVRKECYEKQTVSKHPISSSQTVYEVIFLCENRELLFQVSEVSYPHYRVGQKGTLKWKGKRLLDFS